MVNGENEEEEDEEDDDGFEHQGWGEVLASARSVYQRELCEVSASITRSIGQMQ